MRRLLPLAIALLLAGCLGDTRDPLAADARAAPAEEDALRVAQPPGAPPAHAPYDVPIAYDGRLSPSAMLCGASAACERRGGHAHAPGVADPLLAFTLTLSWTPRSPASEKLLLTVDTCDAHACREVAQVAGASPLTLEVPDAALRGNPLVRVRAPPLAPVLHLEDDAPFHVEGVFTARKVEGRDGFAGHDGA